MKTRSNRKGARLQDRGDDDRGTSIPEMREEGPLQGADARYTITLGDAGDVLRDIPDNSVAVTITSPPYYRQKDYKVGEQIGWESSVEHYVARLKSVLQELLRVTALDGSCFVVVGDTYVHKSLQLVPQRLAVAATECGWTIRNDLIWEKSDAPPDNAADRWRFTHEHILFLTKQPSAYKFNVDTIRIPYAPKTLARWGNGQKYGGNKVKSQSGPEGQRFKRGQSFRLHPAGTIARDVLQHATARSALDHFATFPLSLIEPFLFATTVPGDLVLDPFAGTGTTGIAALRNRRRFLGIELSPTYAAVAQSRLADAAAGEETTERLPGVDARCAIK